MTSYREIYKQTPGVNIMTQTTWEKVAETQVQPAAKKVQWRFILGGVLIFGAILFLIINGTTAGARYYITIKELLNDSKYIGQTVRVSGAVIGDTIQYDSQNLIIQFTIVHLEPTDNNDDALSLALHNAVKDANALRLPVYIENQVKPDLLQHEAQAILTGVLGEDGVFRATELLLKCPSRFEEDDPRHAIVEGGK